MVTDTHSASFCSTYTEKMQRYVICVHMNSNFYEYVALRLVSVYNLIHFKQKRKAVSILKKLGKTIRFLLRLVAAKRHRQRRELRSRCRILSVVGQIGKYLRPN